ncbi:MAG: hypothetical protein J2O48_01865 [Solirubrobacterales bacterium]|nr:hypothetical protein [Solirubrobacterales bacterium]
MTARKQFAAGALALLASLVLSACGEASSSSPTPEGQKPAGWSVKNMETQGVMLNFCTPSRWVSANVNGPNVPGGTLAKVYALRSALGHEFGNSVLDFPNAPAIAAQMVTFHPTFGVLGPYDARKKALEQGGARDYSSQVKTVALPAVSAARVITESWSAESWSGSKGRYRDAMLLAKYPRGAELELIAESAPGGGSFDPDAVISSATLKRG